MRPASAGTTAEMDDRLRRVGIYFGLLDGPEPDPPPAPEPLGVTVMIAATGALLLAVIAGVGSTLLHGEALEIATVARRGAWWAMIFLVVVVSDHWRERRRAREAREDAEQDAP